MNPEAPARRFEPGEAIVARDRWRDYLWAADPCIVVDDDGDRLIGWTPAGTVGCFATSRGYPGRGDLPRSERLLISMETCQWRYRGKAARASDLNFVTAGEWARVALTWLPDGAFLHWYVNFQRPIERFDGGYETMDLVIDLVIEPDGSWSWKDRDDFDAAIHRGILDPAVRAPIEAEAERVLTMSARGVGPFDRHWLAWRPPDGWGIPSLPTGFAGGIPVPPGATVTTEP